MAGSFDEVGAELQERLMQRQRAQGREARELARDQWEDQQELEQRIERLERAVAELVQALGPERYRITPQGAAYLADKGRGR